MFVYYVYHVCILQQHVLRKDSLYPLRTPFYSARGAETRHEAVPSEETNAGKRRTSGDDGRARVGASTEARQAGESTQPSEV